MREVYFRLSQALREGGYYLAGGTALALREGHRVSVDLDVFCPTMPDPDGLLDTLQQSLVPLAVQSVAEKTLYLTVEGTQVSIIEYRYPMLAPLVTPEDGGLALASLDDISAMKLSAIANRGSRKDFVDLWTLLTRYRSLPEYLELFERKFTLRDVGHVVRSLVYFDDAEREPPLRLLVEIDWDALKQDLRGRVSDLLREAP
jgi:hypothetical protein